MAKTLTVTNNTRGLLILNFPHGVVPEVATMGRTGTREYVQATGERIVRAHRHPISGSVTLLAKGQEGSKVGGLPPSIYHAPDVKAALAASPPRISIEEVETKDPEPVAAPQPAAEPPVKEAPTVSAPASKKG
jgi:hypothetical protein